MKHTLEQQRLPKELVSILEEVSKRGFYTAKLDTYIVEATNRDEIINAIYISAKQAHLKVSFNFKLGECVFECE